MRRVHFNFSTLFASFALKYGFEQLQIIIVINSRHISFYMTDFFLIEITERGFFNPKLVYFF